MVVAEILGLVTEPVTIVNCEVTSVVRPASEKILSVEPAAHSVVIVAVNVPVPQRLAASRAGAYTVGQKHGTLLNVTVLSI